MSNERTLSVTVTVRYPRGELRSRFRTGAAAENHLDVIARRDFSDQLKAGTACGKRLEIRDRT